MTPQHTIFNIPQSQKPNQQYHIVKDLLDESQCSQIIAEHTDLIPANFTQGTIRDREMFDDQTLSESLWEKLKPFFGEKLIDEVGREWIPQGLNERFRLCRYLPGGKFSPHIDGKRLVSPNERSFVTINIYLNTIAPSSHGSTRFLAPPSSPNPILAQVQPILGSALIFRDDIWHDGEELLSGEKYLLRTDLMYKRAVDFDFDGFMADEGMSDERKGVEMLEMAQDFEDSGDSVQAVEWYKRAFRLWPPLERGTG